MFAMRAATQALVLANLGATLRELKMRLPDQKELLWARADAGGTRRVGRYLKHVVSFEAVEGPRRRGRRPSRWRGPVQLRPTDSRTDRRG